MVFFEAPHRLAATLVDMVAAWGGDRPGAVCRELTKTYEEVRRGRLEDLAAWAAGEVRGEIVVVVGGADLTPAEATDDELATAVREAVAGGMSRRDAVDAVAGAHGIPRKRVYAAGLADVQGRASTEKSAGPPSLG
jgi:16S rRNA (cytidine1402-2'-O)-methyltransferase